MRQAVRNFVKFVSENLPIQEPIYEFGSLQVAGKRGFTNLRPFFTGKKYIGADMRKGPGVDVVLDLHNIDLPSGSVGTVLVLDTLEHVEYPYKAMEEIHRVLKPDGIFAMSSVMYFPIHGHPHDYWRFTPEAFASLLKIFNSSFVDFAGEKSFPHTVVGLGFKEDVPDETVNACIKRFKTAGPSMTTWRELVMMYLPPVILCPLYRMIKKNAV